MNIFDKLKLPFAKKVKQVPVSWVEEGPEHYYVIHHLLFGYSDSTSVPNGYADIFSDAEVHDVLPRKCYHIHMESNHSHSERRS